MESDYPHLPGMALTRFFVNATLVVGYFTATTHGLRPTDLLP